MTIYEDGLCKQCGRPLVECRDPKNDGWYDAKATTCYYRQAVDGEQAKLQSAKDYKPEPGRIIYAELNPPTQ